ncbi:hypothetical protein HIF96_08690 [Helcococcus kunzii]|uniref:SAP domain-containing protein n=1 Tax=Helcococcus kunzii TaxID=40091 RepID=UPI001C9540F7|nr:SAP domain-containing protein [Helcococcus kunzii]QZO76348.1 hypothetical protein HIF96_08690 [Helcococcus kunzii]
MLENRPDFKDIKSFEEFNRYYWYREELSKVCKTLGLEYRGTKKELNHIIEEYFKGNIIKKSSRNKNKKITDNITLNTPLLECGFSFNQKFRDYFSEQTGIKPFKFNANMAEALRKVKRKNDKNFTIKDMLDVYNGDSDYAKYDNSTNQWNQFVKDFNLDERSDKFSNKMKVAAILWNEVRESNQSKVYSKELLSKYADKIKKYRK